MYCHLRAHHENIYAVSFHTRHRVFPCHLRCHIHICARHWVHIISSFTNIIRDGFIYHWFIFKLSSIECITQHFYCSRIICISIGPLRKAITECRFCRNHYLIQIICHCITLGITHSGILRLCAYLILIPSKHCFPHCISSQHL